MQKHMGWVWIAGFFGLIASANAQTPSSPTANTQFNGIYAFVSSTKVNETYMDPAGRIGQCPDREAGSLTIINGQARLPVFEGTVGPHGELAMRHIPELIKVDGLPGVEGTVSGNVDKDGKVKARRIFGGCNYDTILQKEDAQTPSPSTVSTQYDGTYAFVSATKVNETYTTRGTEHVLRCGDYKGGPLTVVNGQTRYLGRYYEGTVGPRGELAMRNVPEPVKWGGIPGVEKFISGGMDKDGTVRARQISGGCSYDLIWQKASR